MQDSNRTQHARLAGGQSGATSPRSAMLRAPWIALGPVGVTLMITMVSMMTMVAPAHSDITGPEADVEAVIAAHRALVRAYEASDADAFAALLDDAPGLLIFHPRLESRYDGVEKAREGFGRMFAALGPAEWTEVHTDVAVRGDVAWHTAHLLLEAENLAEPFVGRGTEIWVRRDASWKLAHGHWSEHPDTW